MATNENDDDDDDGVKVTWSLECLLFIRYFFRERLADNDTACSMKYLNRVLDSWF